MNLGWECPRCHIIHAPSVLRCTDCVGGLPSSFSDIPINPINKQFGPKIPEKIQSAGDNRCRCGLKSTQTCTNPNCYRNG